MGGGWSTKRSIITNNASMKIEQGKNQEEVKVKNTNKAPTKLELSIGSKLYLLLTFRV